MAASILTPAMSASSPHLSRGAAYRSNTDAGARGIVSSSSSPTLPRDCNPLQLALRALSSPKRAEKRRLQSLRCRCSSSRNHDRIPKEFRAENLKDGLMDNFKNVPSSLYGLSASQMDMFMTEDSLVNRESQKVTEDSISSANSYINNGGMWSLSGATGGPSKYSMSISMYRGGSGYGRHGRRGAPPDLPSLLLDARIIYLGMPIVPAVTELLIAEFMWLDWDDNTKPIYLYINSPGTQDENKELVGSENDAYIIADMMNMTKAKVYTINVSVAFGQAGMLLSIGAKGYRALQPTAYTSLYMPSTHKSNGSVSDMWIKAKELDVVTDVYLDFLARGTGKTKEELREDLQTPKYFRAEEAIAYGLADKILYSLDGTLETKNYDALMAQSKALKKRASSGPQASPFGSR